MLCNYLYLTDLGHKAWTQYILLRVPSQQEERKKKRKEEERIRRDQHLISIALVSLRWHSESTWKMPNELLSLLNFIILGYGKHLCSRLHTSVVIVHAGRKSVLKCVEPLFTLDLALTLCVWQLSRWCRNLKHRYKEKHLYNRTRKANATLCRLSWQYDWRTHRTTAANQNDKSVWRLSQLYMNYNTAQRYKCCTDLHNFFVTPLIFFIFF